MCQDCGCNTSSTHYQTESVSHDTSYEKRERRVIQVTQGLMAESKALATHIRSHLKRHEILTINIMSAPGSGKTSLLEATIQAIGNRYRIAVIEGELETEVDAERIRRSGVPAIQINTGHGCHLDAHMIHDALHELNLSNVDILFIENVGNLVCPVAFDLGQNLNMALLATTEGDDKPAKYPPLFRSADLVLISKSDLLPLITEFSIERASQHIRDLGSIAEVLCVSARNGDGFDLWIDWLEKNVRRLKGEDGQDAHYESYR